MGHTVAAAPLQLVMITMVRGMVDPVKCYLYAVQSPCKIWLLYIESMWRYVWGLKKIGGTGAPTP